MLKAYSRILRKILMLTDIIIVIVGFWAVYSFTYGFNNFESLKNYMVFLYIEVIIWGVFLWKNGAYESFRTKDFSELFYIVFKSAFVGLLIIAGILFFLKMPKIGRDLVTFNFLLSTILLCMYKGLLLWFFHLMRKHGYNYRNILIVGSGKRAVQFIDLVKKNSEWGLKIIGIIDVNKESVGKTIDETPIIGTLNDFPKIIHTNVVDEVIFIVPRSWLEKISDIISFCETEGISSNIALDLFDLKIAKSRQIDVHGFPLVTFETTPSRVWHLLLKRMFDIFISLIGIIFLLLPLLITALFIKFTSPGPIFFCQKRKGLHGRIFTIYKFRTMVNDAEKKLHELKNFNEMEGPVFKINNDPRITKIGKFLRKFSIDEFPQLWNVLIGDMSIIGPRPPLSSEVELYENWQRRRLSMRPGLTCLWQVRGRNNITDFKKWAELDLQYIDNWSIFMDINIFLKTIPVVLFGIGAK